MLSKEQLKELHDTHHSGQKLEELWWLYSRVGKIEPHIVMEIGIYAGGTLKIWSTLCSKPTDMVIGLDYNLDLWNEHKAGSTAPKWDITKSTVPIHIIEDDSHLPETIKKVDSLLSGRKIDFLFIDGDHSFSGVKKDYEMWSPLVKDNGIIGFHDLTMPTVKLFWSSLKCAKHEFYAKEPYGIGYVIKDKK